MRRVERLFLVSEALDEAFDGPVSQQDLLSLADVIVKSDQEGFVGEYDRPLNGSNPNFYSLPVDLALSCRGFAIAAKETGRLDDAAHLGVDCPRERFAELCKQVSAH